MQHTGDTWLLAEYRLFLLAIAVFSENLISAERRFSILNIGF